MACFRKRRISINTADSESSTSSTTVSSGGVGGDWGNILDSADLDAISCDGSDGRLGAWAWGLGLDTTSSSELDVDGVDSDVLEGVADIDGSKHCYKGAKKVRVSFRVCHWSQRSVVQPICGANEELCESRDGCLTFVIDH